MGIYYLQLYKCLKRLNNSDFLDDASIRNSYLKGLLIVLEGGKVGDEIEFHCGSCCSLLTGVLAKSAQLVQPLLYSIPRGHAAVKFPCTYSEEGLCLLQQEGDCR